MKEYSKEELKNFANRYYYEGGKAYSYLARELFALYISYLEDERYTYKDFSTFLTMDKKLLRVRVILSDTKKYKRFTGNESAKDWLETEIYNNKYSICDAFDNDGDDYVFALTTLEEELINIMTSLEVAMRDCNLKLFTPYVIFGGV